MLKINKIYQQYYDERKLFDKEVFNIEEGITVICGCNGSGKTTLFKQIRDYINKEYSKQLDDKELSLISFDENGFDGKTHRDKLFRSQDYAGFASDAFSSEGESRFDRFGYVIKQIGKAVRNKHKIIVCLIDGLDSGVSIDLLRCYIEGLQFVEKEVKKNNIELYILLTTNQYELTKDFKTIDVTSLAEIKFDTYNDYVDYIMKNKEIKDKRIIDANEKEDEKQSLDFERNK